MADSDFELRPTGAPPPEYRIERTVDGVSLQWTIESGDDAPMRLPRALRPPRAADSGAATASQARPQPPAQPVDIARAAPPPARTPSLADVLRGAEARNRVEATRRSLAVAVEMWWRTNALPSDALLRDGLLALEAGHHLDDAQRTLLARTALARGRGVLTALHHVDDPERVATLVHDAVMSGVLTPNGLRALLVDDALDPVWIDALEDDLHADLNNPAAALRAQAALNLIEAARTHGRSDSVLLHTLQPDGTARAWVRVVAALCLLAALLSLWYWRTRAADAADLVDVAAGAYLVGNESGAQSRLPVAAFAINRTEVTWSDYRACVVAGVCTPPEDEAALNDAARATYPVSGVTWDAAQQYCTWRGQRLPSAAEWEVAAGYAPATGRAYRFPWGELWEPTFVIGGAENGFAGPVAVGSRSPQGDSPMGAADMAGNLAEWTSTPAVATDGQALVKGGSYRDGAQAFQVAAFTAHDKRSPAAWIGFRCAQAR